MIRDGMLSDGRLMPSLVSKVSPRSLNAEMVAV